MEWAWGVHRWAFRLSGGILGSRAFGIPVLQLTTTGRVSGRPREVMLHYFQELGNYVVIASHAGELRNPPWYLNHKANPAAVAQVGPDRIQVLARDAAGAERDRLWAKAVELDPAYAEYQGRTERQIPVVILDRI